MFSNQTYGFHVSLLWSYPTLSPICLLVHLLAHPWTRASPLPLDKNNKKLFAGYTALVALALGVAPKSAREWRRSLQVRSTFRPSTVQFSIPLAFLKN